MDDVVGAAAGVADPGVEDDHPRHDLHLCRARYRAPTGGTGIPPSEPTHLNSPIRRTVLVAGHLPKHRQPDRRGEPATDQLVRDQIRIIGIMLLTCIHALPQ